MTQAVPRPSNSLLDIPGLKVGHFEQTRHGYLTGTTVIHAPRLTVAGVDQRGGAPGTRETDLLSPLNSNPGVNAVVLTGGSAYGLNTASGVMQWLEHHGQGVPVGPPGSGRVVPIVPAAVIYDLGRGGRFSARPAPAWGNRAIDTATADSGCIRLGNVGAGTGAIAGGLKGGLGTASTILDDLDDGTGKPIVVAALVIVNAAGSPIDRFDGRSLLAAHWMRPEDYDGDYDDGLPDHRNVQESTPLAAPGEESAEEPLNTTIGLVATTASLEKAAATRMAGAAHDGLARAIAPAHTLHDGDTFFSLATGTGTPLANNNPTHSRRLNAIYNAAATTVTRAIGRALLAAETTHGIASYRDTYPGNVPGRNQKPEQVKEKRA